MSETLNKYLYPFKTKARRLSINILRSAMAIKISYVQKSSVKLLAKLIKLPDCGHAPEGGSISIIAGGDVSFDTVVRSHPFFGVDGYIEVKRKPGILSRVEKRILNYFISQHARNLAELPFRELMVKRPENEQRKYLSKYYKEAVRFNPGPEDGFRYPFEKIAPLLKRMDLAIVNLETPLSDEKRAAGFFISKPGYTKAIKGAGISLVSLANNHIFDAGEKGFLDTIKHLEAAGIQYTGGGRNLEEARAGKRIQIKGSEIAFLSYTQWCIHRYASIAADYPGILPLDVGLMTEDILVAKMKVDLVFVCIHWGYENQPNVHPRQIEIAHTLIDAGADAIIGHHPHVPHGIEIYRNRPIFYSLGNFIFGQAQRNWVSDNFLAEIIIHDKTIKGVVIHPIAGRREDLFQPRTVDGDRAIELLRDLQLKSLDFDTNICVSNSVGYIDISTHRESIADII